MSRLLPRPALSTQGSTLSISRFAGVSRRSGKATSANFGAVELMALAACDKVIYQKIKLILAMDMANSALDETKARTAPDGAPPTIIVLETESGDDTITIFQQPDPEESGIGELELTLLKQLSVLGQVLRRYDIIGGLALAPNLPWMQLSFTRVRSELVDLFIEQVSPIPFIRTIPPRRGCVGEPAGGWTTSPEKSVSLDHSYAERGQICGTGAVPITGATIVGSSPRVQTPGGSGNSGKTSGATPRRGSGVVTGGVIVKAGQFGRLGLAPANAAAKSRGLQLVVSPPTSVSGGNTLDSPSSPSPLVHIYPHLQGRNG
ncbi:hypothetical protein DFJ73DRAFT_775156 [Zopfochytrium polystomum]|nr:hypothetical protein DFJ73DRAFT_775156 [Zopfochytrium polystomum]